MKNVIFIVVDSVFYNNINSNEHRNSPTPFIRSLMEKGMYTEKMYSEAPYTEAALVSLLCGVDTLKYGGYLKKLANKKTILEVFKENKYDVFFNALQPLVYPKYSYPGLTDSYYNVCYDFNSCWEYRLSYYSDIYNTNGLNDEYISLLTEMLEDNLNAWVKFFEDIINKEKNTNLIYQMIDISEIEKNHKLLNIEIIKFKDNKIDYLKDLLVKRRNHELFKIKTYSLDKKTTFDFKKNLYNENYKLFKKIYNVNLKKNLLNNRIVFNDLFKDNKKFIKLLKVYKNALFDKDLMDKINPNINVIKNSPSMSTSLEHFENWLMNRKSNKPYFAYIHTEECHYPEIFYSHDSNDTNKLKEEFKLINDYVSKLPKNYKGCIAYDLALQYTDLCIKKLYSYLEKNNLLDNTIISICADHGSSYTFDPFHDNYVRNIYRENYNIPFILVGDGIKHEVKTNYFNSKDIPATIIDACNLKVPKCYDGKSLLKYNGNDYAIIENINGGCPDYNYRNFYLGARTDNYYVVMELNMHKDFKKCILYAVYDMKKDKYERNNIKDKKNIDISYELTIIEKKFKELVDNTKDNNFVSRW